MRILIDALSARAGGGVTYIEHILPALVDLQTGHEFSVLFSPQYQQGLIETVPPGVKVVTADLPAEPLARRWWYLQTGLVRLIKDLHADVFYAPAESSYVRKPVPMVMLSRNPSIYAMPSAFGSQRLALIKHRLARQLPVFVSMQRADRVLFVSQTFRQQVVHQMRLDPVKTRTVYHGVDSRFFEPVPRLDDLPVEGPYFVAVSTINPHKNYETLIRAYAGLPPDAPPLLIAGKPLHTPTSVMLQELVAQLGLQDRVHFLGGVAYDKLPALYQGAVASVMPSRLETFGHPLVEAMAAQTPVIASDIPVCHEICGEAALYFDCDDPDTLREHMQAVWQDEALRERMKITGKRRAADFSWQQSARRLVSVFEELR